ncbi:MAG: hypothetical protein LBH51_01330 [Treponema sp.]|jgi:hypothetical protein|nr:hypothetical protein [Treponema sp.]
MEKPGMGRPSLFGTGLLILGFLAAPFLSAQSAPQQEASLFYWRDPPPFLTVGQEVRLALCVSGEKGPEQPIPPPVPPMIVMESLPPEDDELLAFRVIPLGGSLFTLPSFPLFAGLRAPESPPLRIPVNPAPGPSQEGRKILEPPVPDIPARESGGLPPFPPLPPEPEKIPWDTAWGRRVREQIQALWEEGKAVESLAELRRLERDHIAGFTLRPLRRDLERALLLEEEDELFRHPLLLIPASALCLILGVLSLALPHILGKKRGKRGAAVWMSRGLCLGFSVLALLFFLRLISVRSLSVYFTGNSPRQALARKAAVYQVPENGGTRIAVLREGQGLLIYETRDGWAYAESPGEEIAGWIKTGSFLVY